MLANVKNLCREDIVKPGVEESQKSGACKKKIDSELKDKTPVTCLWAEALPRYNDIKLTLNMNAAKHELLFSKIRLGRYVTACKGDTSKALNLYKYNIQACQALYPVISVLEVSLRNSIDREMTKHYGDSNWLISQRLDFAENPRLVYKDRNGKEQGDIFF